MDWSSFLHPLLICPSKTDPCYFLLTTSTLLLWLLFMNVEEEKKEEAAGREHSRKSKD